jgi:hypothetical protein
MAAATANAVLNTVELFEMTILHLPIKDIVRLTGVNSVWRKRILGGSMQIREALFFEPRHTTTVSWKAMKFQPIAGKPDELENLNPLFTFSPITRDPTTIRSLLRLCSLTPPPLDQARFIRLEHSLSDLPTL